MGKKTFFVVTVGSDDFKYSYAFSVRNNENLWGYVESLSKHAKVEWLSACDSKRDAVEMAKGWNCIWQDRGILWLSAPTLYTVIYN